MAQTHGSFLRRSLLRLGVPSASVDDAAQRTLLVVARRIDDIVPGREKTFLFGVAMRVARTVRREADARREVRDEPLLAALPAGGGDAGEQLDERRARALLDGLLEALPLELRTVFVLHQLEEMTMAEIASALDVPNGTVASRLRRARVAFDVLSRRVQARRRNDERNQNKDEVRRALALLPLAAVEPDQETLPLVHAWKLKAAAAIAMLAGGAALLVLARTNPAPHSSPVSAPVAIAAPASAPSAALPSSPPRSASAPPPVPTSASRPPVRSARPTLAPVAARAHSAPAASVPQPGALSAEIVLVQQATQSLARRDPDAALSVLSTYARRYPHGALSAEAGYLQVQALLASGDRGAAMELAARLLAADPHGILAPKLEAVIASEPVP